MIFVTVGAQMPFDRLVRTVDRWAALRRRSDVFAQIGRTACVPVHFPSVAFLEPPEFRKQIEAADVIVAHAGMGSILTALELGKPILVMPRRGDLLETRNDHQVATARRFLAQGRIDVAFDEAELLEKLDHLADCQAAGRISATASPRLIAALRAFVQAGPASAPAPAPATARSPAIVPASEVAPAPAPDAHRASRLPSA